MVISTIFESAAKCCDSSSLGIMLLSRSKNTMNYPWKQSRRFNPTRWHSNSTVHLAKFRFFFFFVCFIFTLSFAVKRRRSQCSGRMVSSDCHPISFYRSRITQIEAKILFYCVTLVLCGWAIAPHSPCDFSFFKEITNSISISLQP